MVHVCLQLPGSHWAKRQGRLRETNKAVLILLIVRNVLIETRKKLIHMTLNQSHAACTEFRRTLVKQLSCPLTNGCRDSVSSSPLHNHHRTMLVHSNRPCLNPSNATSVHCHFKQMCHLWLLRRSDYSICSGFRQKTLEEELQISQNELIRVVLGLSSRAHVGKQMQKLRWLTSKTGVKQLQNLFNL